MQRIVLLPLNLIIEFFEGLGRYTVLMAKMFRSIGSLSSIYKRTLEQMVIIGANSIPIVTLTSFFSGMVTSVQSAYQITSSLIPPETIGSIVGETILLELAPVISALVLTGRVGATITAEIGTMRVTEQIDALESLSFDPVSFLILPRVIAGSIMFPILIVIADYCGVIGGWTSVIIDPDINVTTYQFFDGFKQWFKVWSAWVGIIKALFFGFAITSIACYHGYFTDGGAAGVGKATTMSVVSSCMAVVFLDYFLSSMLL
tara:strand:+ start:14924 stop:15703 length:780 start_codon:yes stop_codon:yes gene_type:complete